MKIPGLGLLKRLIYSFVEAREIIRRRNAEAKALIERHNEIIDDTNPIIQFRKERQ